MNIHDIPYPLRLCFELLHYSAINCPKTENMKASEIRAAVAVFFSEEDISAALGILTGKLPSNAKDQPPGASPARATSPF
jgi:hypothetical protein